MPMYVIRSCPTCKKVFESSSDYRALGKPYKICQYCGTIIRLTHITEWELKSSSEKLSYIGVITFTAFAFGAVGGVFALFGLNYFFKLIDMNSTDFTPLYLSAIVGFINSGIIYTFRLRKEIEKSNQRMKDPEYREILTKIGLL